MSISTPEDIELRKQQYAAIDPFGYSNRQMMQSPQSDSAEAMLSRWELDSTEILDRFKHNLKRELQNENGDWVRVIGAKPKLNDEGISWIITFLDPILNKNTYLSHYKESRILSDVKDHIITIIETLYYSHRNFEMEINDFIPTVRDCEALILSAYLRALEGGERNYRKMIMKLIEQRTERDTSRRDKKGFFSSFKLFNNDKNDEGMVM